MPQLEGEREERKIEEEKRRFNDGDGSQAYSIPFPVYREEKSTGKSHTPSVCQKLELTAVGMCGIAET